MHKQLIRISCAYTCILLLHSGIIATAQSGNDTLSVYFELNIATLNRQAQTTIDSVYYTGSINMHTTIDIIGYTDFLATDAYNLTLSRQRAENVKAYLLGFGLKEEHIRLVLGKGEVKRTDTSNKRDGIPGDRRVDMVFYSGKTKAGGQHTKNFDTIITMKPRYKKAATITSADSGFDIHQIEKGQSFILENIYFPMGRHFPKETSYPSLNMLVDALQTNLNMNIQIEGHVCCVSGVPDAYDLDSHQLNLSLNRARFIYEYLISQDIDPLRLRYIGYGRTRPVIPNEITEEDASANRRVEIRILQK